MSAATAEPLPSENDYDVVVIGGGFAGSSVARLLRERLPRCRILVLERREAFDRKVGEATVEVSGFFLARVLGEYDALSRDHLPKHGLRFWFTDRPGRRLDEMTEVGPGLVPHLPSFQLDRARLDEHLLARAEASGVETLRRARVSEVDLDASPRRVRFTTPDGDRTVTARWVVDASGRRAYLAKRLGIWRENGEHSTSAVWCRWRGVLDLDAPATLAGRAEPGPTVAAARRLATNHFCGYGWWCWVIPLAGGETSVGLVFDRDLFELPGTGNVRRRYRRFVTAQAGLRDLLADAEMVERDCRTYPHLAYSAGRYAGPGWALVGDAGSFIDPYYSPGLDHAAISIHTTVELLAADLAGGLDSRALAERIDEHNTLWSRSYTRWFDALYRDKYEILGDSELTTAAFLVDTAMYYLGVVSPIYDSAEHLDRPVFGRGDRGTTGAYRFLSRFNRRLVHLARYRGRTGRYGRANAGRQVVARSPDLGRGALPMLLQGLTLWLRLEAEYLGYRVTHRRLDLTRPAPPGAAPVASGTA